MPTAINTIYTQTAVFDSYGLGGTVISMVRVS